MGNGFLEEGVWGGLGRGFWRIFGFDCWRLFYRKLRGLDLKWWLIRIDSDRLEAKKAFLKIPKEGNQFLIAYRPWGYEELGRRLFFEDSFSAFGLFLQKEG